jgi:hypothetical protein
MMAPKAANYPGGHDILVWNSYSLSAVVFKKGCIDAYKAVFEDGSKYISNIHPDDEWLKVNPIVMFAMEGVLSVDLGIHTNEQDNVEYIMNTLRRMYIVSRDESRSTRLHALVSGIVSDGLTSQSLDEVIELVAAPWIRVVTAKSKIVAAYRRHLQWRKWKREMWIIHSFSSLAARLVKENSECVDTDGQ